MKKSLKKMFVAVLLVALICSSLSVFAAPEEDGIAVVAEDDAGASESDATTEDNIQNGSSEDESKNTEDTENDDADSGNENDCEHSNKVHHDATGTCTTKGTIEYWECGDCGACFSDEAATKQIDADNIPEELGSHEIGDEIPETPGTTCQENGTIAHYECSLCNTNFSDAEGKNVLDTIEGEFGSHKIGDEIPETPGTCQTKATIAHYECEVCHKNFEDAAGEKELPTIEGDYGSHHIVKVAAQPGTCKEREIIEHYKCDVEGCNKLFADEKGTTPLNNISIRGEFGDHDLKLIPAANGTCVKLGTIEHYYCSECEKNFDTDKTTELASITGKLGTHNAIKIDAKDATETESGNIECWHCSECDKFFRDEALTKEIPAYDIIIPATGDVDGPELPDVVDPTPTVSIDKEDETIPDIKLDNDAYDEIINSAFTETEIKSGKQLKIDLNVAAVSETNIAQSELEAINAAAKQRKIAVIYDINLVKLIDGIILGNVNQLDKEITMTIDVPKAFLADNRKFSIIRLHDGIAEELSDLDDNPNTVTFTTGKFSLYALVYEDVKEVAASPNTGDSTPVAALAVVMLATIVLAVLCIKKMKKDNI